ALLGPHWLDNPPLDVAPAVVAELADPGDQLEKPGDPVPIPEGVPVDLPRDARGERDVLRLHRPQGCVVILRVGVAGEVAQGRPLSHLHFGLCNPVRCGPGDTPSPDLTPAIEQ